MQAGSTFALQLRSESVIFFAALTGSTDLMANLFHIPTTDRLAGQDAGMSARAAFADAHAVTDGTIAPAGRRTR
jgi:hypothetical protein